MKNKSSWIGGIGAGITAICCFTPVLVFALTAIGAAGLIGYLDYILLPSLFGFLALFAYGVYRAKTKDNCCSSETAQSTK